MVDSETEEIRLAIALNGGVSLAIWMGGVAVELDSARRAHLAPESVGLTEDPADGPPRTIYNALCEGFQRTVVIDILAGASAGGINGALLAGAIRSRRRLHADFLRDKWAEIGDFSSLLQPLTNDRPRSIMRGDQFLKEITSVFQAVLGSNEAADDDLALTALPVCQRGLPVGDVKLDITATDVVGEEKRFRDDWGFDLYARDYRGRFKFRDAGDFTVDNLATAARASASFPAAFEPLLVDRLAQQNLASFTSPRWLIDGGLLDNAPIRSALQLIPSRRAARQVERILCYINADPPAPDEPQRFGPDGPSLLSVGGYVLDLPRRAPFIDHIEAIQAAVRERATVAETLVPLLKMDIETLLTVAVQMLPAYCERRRLVAVADLFGNTGAAAEDAATYLDICWPTFSLDPPYSAEHWTWGIRTAIDIGHLILDLMRTALPRADDKAALLRQRLVVFDALSALEGVLRLSRIAAAEAASSDAALDVTNGYNRASFLRVREAVEAVYSVADQLGLLPPNPAESSVAGESPVVSDGPAGENYVVADILFGPDRPDVMSRACFEMFMRRALAIEVIRRSFIGDSAATSAQRLRFAQLTPLTPCPIFSYHPLTDEGPATPEAKLTGIRLGHFAAFYRSSWRVNDFMWGRLDAAARVVQLLVDPLRANDPGMNPSKDSAAVTITRALLPTDATLEQRWLIDEALREASAFDPGMSVALRKVADSLANYPGGKGDEPPTAEALRPSLEKAVETDLRNIDGGRFTRIICTRAAQLEILAQELGCLVDASVEDVSKGTLAPALDVPRSATRAAIINLRDGYDRGETLPIRLGRDRPDELASALALRTTTHAALVSLAALREAKIPLGGLLSSLRAPLLPAAGLASKTKPYRAMAITGFWGCAIYLTGRIVTTGLDTTEAEHRLLGGALAVLALLVVLGTAGVPFLRARQAAGSRALTEYAFALALVIFGFLGAGLLAVLFGNRGLRDLIVAPDSRAAGAWWLALALAIGAGLPRARLPVIGGYINRIIAKPWAGRPALVLVLVALGILVYPAVSGMVKVLTEDPEAWEVIAVVLAGFAGPAAITYLFFRGGRS